MKVHRVFRIVGDSIVADDPINARSGFTVGDVIALLTNISSVAGASIPSTIELLLTAGTKRQHINLALEPFIFADELAASQDAPICFVDLRGIADAVASGSLSIKPGRWLWLFRNGFYVTERPVHDPEIEELILSIKARHYRGDEQLKRLRAEIANFEAIDQTGRESRLRRPLRDDVKLLVWARDGGRCTSCHSDQDLQFDHVIPFALGGSDESENIQLLCRSCNLAKSDRIV